ncbi:hypothetical protein B6U98_00035 [Thermoplasmatales archaeon ex4572_165]|nr:MAG: hypothetical protein B6U98_00035 [Thermoplasmatales archaeon ex4572_165]
MIFINLAIESIFWLVNIIVSVCIGMIFLFLYLKDKEKKKLIFVIAFISSTISHVYCLFGYNNIEQGILGYNVYNWTAIPLLIALFIALNSRFFKTKEIYDKKFSVFVGLNLLCFVFAWMPINSNIILTPIRQIISIELIVGSVYWLIKTHDRSYLIYLTVIFFFMLGGIGMARNINFLPMVSYPLANIFILFLFVNPFKTINSKSDGISSFFTLEQKLKTSEKKYRQLFNSMPASICLLSKDGTIIESNGQMANNFNLSPEEIIGKNIRDLLPPDIYKERNDIAIKVLNSGKMQENKDERNGKYFHNRYIPIKMGDENNIMVIANDITHENKIKIEKEEKMRDLRNTELATLNIMEDMHETVQDLEKAKSEILEKNEELTISTEELQAMNQELDVIREQLSDINQNLEYKVDERTKEVHRLIEIKDEFINQLSHDLKTPITPLNTLLPLIQKKCEDEKIKEMLTVCIEKVKYMKILVKNTLELARMNSPTLELQQDDINLADEVNSIVESISFNYETNHIQIENQIIDDIHLKVDTKHFKELLFNLVSNAVKFNKDSGTVTINAEETKDNMIQISINDTGMGMTEEQVNHVFDEFYKADESRHDFTGTGLGLSICKKIVEKHQGKIWIESTGIGKGSTVYLTIPKGTDQ